MTILFAVVAVLIWLPFNVNIQSPLSCLLAGGENENLKAELNNLKELHSEVKSEYHKQELDMVRLEKELSERKLQLDAANVQMKECKAVKEEYHKLELEMAKVGECTKQLQEANVERKECSNLKDEINTLKLEKEKADKETQIKTKEEYHKLERETVKKKLYNDLWAKHQKQQETMRDANHELEVAMARLEEKIRACYEKFNLVTSAMVVRGGNQTTQDEGKCPTDDVACHIAVKAARMLSWVVHLGGSSDKSS